MSDTTFSGTLNVTTNLVVGGGATITGNFDVDGICEADNFTLNGTGMDIVKSFSATCTGSTAILLPSGLTTTSACWACIRDQSVDLGATGVAQAHVQASISGASISVQCYGNLSSVATIFAGTATVDVFAIGNL